ncbi:MAG: hypothetical protein ACFFF4_15890 [Candidatus Thorarchaeota archaeon]
MVSDKVKFHLVFLVAFSFLLGLTLLFAYLGIVGLLFGLEISHLFPIFMGGGYIFVAIILIYYGLVELTKGYLANRGYLVPELCPKCEEKLYSSTVEWIKENRVQCPECGLEFEVTKGWDV